MWSHALIFFLYKMMERKLTFIWVLGFRDDSVGGRHLYRRSWRRLTEKELIWWWWCWWVSLARPCSSLMLPIYTFKGMQRLSRWRRRQFLPIGRGREEICELKRFFTFKWFSWRQGSPASFPLLYQRLQHTAVTTDVGVQEHTLHAWTHTTCLNTHLYTWIDFHGNSVVSLLWCMNLRGVPGVTHKAMWAPSDVTRT